MNIKILSIISVFFLFSSCGEPAREEKSSLSAREEKPSLPAREEKSSLSAREEKPSLSAREEKPCLPAREEKSSLSAREEKPCLSAREEKSSLSAREEKPSLSAREEKPCLSAREEKPCLSNIVVNQEVKFSLDSVVVIYWDSTEAEEYQFNINKDSLQIDSKYFSFYKKIKNERLIKKIINYIDIFYINKTKKIITSRNKHEDYIESVHSPIIQVIGYKDEIKVFDKETMMAEEMYDIEFNPKFLEFYEFLDSLIR